MGEKHVWVSAARQDSRIDVSGIASHTVSDHRHAANDHGRYARLLQGPHQIVERPKEARSLR
jgi:hypothetical protein